MPYWLELDVGVLGLGVILLWLGLGLALGLLSVYRRHADEEVRRGVLTQLLLAARRGLPLTSGLGALAEELHRLAQPEKTPILAILLLILIVPPVGLLWLAVRAGRWVVRRRRRRESELVYDVAAGLEEGDLEAALQFAKRAFPAPIPALLGTAQREGTLVEALEEVQDLGETQERLRGDARGRLVYPLIVLTGVEVVGLFVALVVFPKLNEIWIHTTSGSPLPVSLLVLTYMRRALLVGVPLLLALLWVLAGLLAAPGGVGSPLRRRVPWLRRADAAARQALFARQLAAFLRSGLPLPEALRAVAPLKSAVAEAARRADEGAGLVPALSGAGLLADDSLAQLACGPGAEIAALEAVAAQAAAEFRSVLDRLVQAVLPVAFLGIGLLVASTYWPPFLYWHNYVEALLW